MSLNLNLQRRITRFVGKEEERGQLWITDTRLNPLIGKLVELEITIREIEEDYDE